MNSREKKVKDKYEKQGWRMLRGGSPDFIALRVDAQDNIAEFQGIEVKRAGVSLSYEQAVYQKFFALAGVPYIVEVIE